MALPVWADNLIAYSLQIAISASVGTLLAYLFRLRVPRVSFIYWQILLLVCLLLPALQNWKHPVQFGEIPDLERQVSQLRVVSPGLLGSTLVRTEKVMESAAWLDLSNSESPRFAGRAVVALAADPGVMERTGSVVVVAQLARDYGFTDIDGKTPRPLMLEDV